MVAVTGSTPVRPDSGSVARTVSPGSSLSIALALPSASTTRVPAANELQPGFFFLASAAFRAVSFALPLAPLASSTAFLTWLAYFLLSPASSAAFVAFLM
jgi:hypothetical protein